MEELKSAGDPTRISRADIARHGQWLEIPYHRLKLPRRPLAALITSSPAESVALVGFDLNVLDCLVHNAHRIEVRGDSMREHRGKPNA